MVHDNSRTKSKKICEGKVLPTSIMDFNRLKIERERKWHIVCVPYANREKNNGGQQMKNEIVDGFFVKLFCISHFRFFSICVVCYNANLIAIV